MFTYRVRLLRLFGFDVFIDASWVLLALLIVWSLAVGVFPAAAPRLKPVAYLWMGLVAAAGLFASIVFHEMCHSMVGRRFGMPIRGITLFIFGGVAEMSDEPTSAGREFLMALAGPAASAVLGVVLLFAAGLASPLAPRPAIAVLSYLGTINLVLAGFNLIPAFPLDGGRMLRAALWGWRKDIVWASRVASVAGQMLAIVLMAFGLVQIFLGGFVGGLWLGLIGLFLHGASAASYRQVLARQALKGQQISQFMTTPPVAASADISVQTFVDEFIYRHHHKRFPVVERGDLVGCVSTTEIAELDRSSWSEQTVGEVMRPCGPDDVATPGSDALEALAKIQRSGGPLMVAEGRRLIGVLSLRDLMKVLTLKFEFEGRRSDPLRAGPVAVSRDA
jgi:Zn-dependent protease/predicted transcriptional regulator